jgi:hypothetical protein
MIEGEAWTIDHPLIGDRVAEIYDGKVYGGTIARVLPSHTDSDGEVEEIVAYVEFDDGDDADLTGEIEIQRAKDMVRRLPPALRDNNHNNNPDVPAVRQSARIAAKQRAFTASSSRVTQRQLRQMVMGLQDAPSEEYEETQFDASDSMLSGEEFCCLPTSSYDAAGNWLEEDQSSVDYDAVHPMVVSSPPTHIDSSLSNPPSSAISLTSHEEVGTMCHPVMEVEYVSEEEVVGRRVWEEMYRQPPTLWECDVIQNLCTILQRAPTAEDISKCNSPNYNDHVPVNVHMLKARVLRTDRNPSFGMVKNSPALQREFGPAIEKWREAGLTEGYHEFITDQQVIE